MKSINNINFIILADDDPDDRMLMIEAFEENNIPCTIQCVEDGAELLDYLTQKGKYLKHSIRLPDLILLDINMPRVNGKEALKAIKSHPMLKHIPVLIFSTSKSLEEITHAYTLGANSFIVKPSSFDGILEIAKSIKQYWIDTVSLNKIVAY